MLAATIVLLPHQIASAIVFSYAGLAVVFTKYPPNKPPQSVKLPELLSRPEQHQGGATNA
jgi:hypothetical protein